MVSYRRILSGVAGLAVAGGLLVAGSASFTTKAPVTGGACTQIPINFNHDRWLISNSNLTEAQKCLRYAALYNAEQAALQANHCG
jgi:hypothetical protein